MTIEQIKETIQGKQYDFLRTNEHLGEKIILLTLGGSYAYGTNVDTSDLDVRGCALSSKADILGLSSFEQVIDTGTDTTVYSFNKLIRLLVDCNPNTIELLGCKWEHYLLLTDIGQELLDSRKIFLSKRAIHSFGGYAAQQLRRLENALARDKMPQARKEEHILHSMQNALQAFKDKYTSLDRGSIILYTAESNRDNLDSEIYADIYLDKYPVREFNGIVSDLTNVVRTYDRLNHRNHKKDDRHLNKHAMHLVRLYFMCLDVLEKEEIITYRENDRDLLMRIRSGEFQHEDGTYRTEFFDLIDQLEDRLKYAKENTSLPDNPDMEKVEEFVMDVNRRSLDV